MSVTDIADAHPCRCRHGDTVRFHREGSINARSTDIGADMVTRFASTGGGMSADIDIDMAVGHPMSADSAAGICPVGKLLNEFPFNFLKIFSFSAFLYGFSLGIALKGLP